MATFNRGEIIPLISRYGIPPKVRDTRWLYQKNLAVYLILASTLFERTAFYSLVVNTVPILKSPEFGWNSPNSATTALYIFSGTCYISTFLFAAISDAKLGRAKTIAVGFIPYLIGYVVLNLLLYNKTKETLCGFGFPDLSIFHKDCDLLIVIALVCTAIGAGAVQSNMAVFGAEQIQESEIASRYFDKYVVAVNTGGIIAMLVIPYIGRDHFYMGAIVAGAMLIFAMVLFIIGCRYYIHVPPFDSVMTTCIPVAFSACKARRQYKINKRRIERERLNSTSMKLMNASVSDSRIEESVRIDERPSTFLDYAKVPNQGRFIDRVVDNVKSVPSALAVFIILIPYWLIYIQLSATFPLQGGQMSTPNGKYMTIRLMSLGDPITMIIGIFVLNMFVYKYVSSENSAMMLTTKFVIGMCLAAVTMCIAGTVEGFRQNQCDRNLKMNESNLTIFAQLPQNIGMGLAELFATVASYEFAYFAAPRSAQSLFMSLHFCSAGIASFIGTVYINVFTKSGLYINFNCLTDKDWAWSFYTYFFVLAGVQLISVLILIGCQSRFQIIKVHPEKMKHYEFF